MSATQRALGTYEILQNIIIHLPVEFIPNVALVATAWHDIVSKSIAIPRTYCLSPLEQFLPLRYQSNQYPLLYDLAHRFKIHAKFDRHYSSIRHPPAPRYKTLIMYGKHGPSIELYGVPIPACVVHKVEIRLRYHWIHQHEPERVLDSFATWPPCKVIPFGIWTVSPNFLEPTVYNKDACFLEAIVYKKDGIRVRDILDVALRMRETFRCCPPDLTKEQWSQLHFRGPIWTFDGQEQYSWKSNEDSDGTGKISQPASSDAQ